MICGWLLPTPSDWRFVCSRTPLADLASRVVALDPKVPAPIKLIFSTEGIEFSAKSPAGMVSGYLEADHQDLPGEVTLRFNSRFLTDALSNLISDRVETDWPRSRWPGPSRFESATLAIPRFGIW